ncbi:copper homeostasis protein CutC [Carnobacteriaceae bacterium zg-C25]|nr:copper homeostasis protein CutC [Carnobacteriaceae bacterium zg-C25]
MLVEVCAGSLKDCIIAQQNGAHRIELNSALFLGGLTPSISTLVLAKRHVTIPIICMVRPRGAGFCYDDYDKDVMFADAQLLLENGADGIAFGFLKADKTIDVDATRKMIDLIHRYKKQAVFHRAFDCVENPYFAIETLIDLQCDRLLTSGLQESAIKGRVLLKKLQDKYGANIELCMGAGVNAENIQRLKQDTGIRQCHASFKHWIEDDTTSGKNVSYRYSADDAFDGVSAKKLKTLIEILGD